MPKKLFIGIKKLWYTDPLTTEPTPTSIPNLIKTAKEVENVHEGTWGYSQDDPNVNEYINELTGKPYYRDKESDGPKTISFTIGEYEYEDKAALQGGEVITTSTNPKVAVGWKSSGALQNIEKAIIAQTKTGRYVIFTNAAIVGKTDVQEKNLGLGVSAVALDNPNTGVEAEYWYDDPSTISTAPSAS